MSLSKSKLEAFAPDIGPRAWMVSRDTTTQPSANGANFPARAPDPGRLDRRRHRRDDRYRSPQPGVRLTDRFSPDLPCRPQPRKTGAFDGRVFAGATRSGSLPQWDRNQRTNESIIHRVCRRDHRVATDRRALLDAPVRVSQNPNTNPYDSRGAAKRRPTAFRVTRNSSPSSPSPTGSLSQ